MVNTKAFLNRDENQKLLERVEKFENRTGCELIYHIRQKLGPHPLEANKKLFYKFGLHKTKDHNAILVTLALAERQFAIWVDEGVMRRVYDKLWSDVGDKMSQSLKAGQNLKALLWVPEMSEDILTKEQPAASKLPTGNEISDQPILGDEDEPK